MREDFVVKKLTMTAQTMTFGEGFEKYLEYYHCHQYAHSTTHRNRTKNEEKARYK
jgi:hypothetical protein